MFNLNRSGKDKNYHDKNLKSDWLKFSSNSIKDDFLASIARDNKFVIEDMKIRTMVVDMLKQEFGENIKNIKDYDYLVDSVVNRIKDKQLNIEPSINT